MTPFDLLIHIGFTEEQARALTDAGLEVIGWVNVNRLIGAAT